MIKFFQKLRLDALSRKRIPKYFTYAVGEIILVVIGILIALQINNWNENRKAGIEETAILQRLLENLSLAKKQSEVLIKEERVLKTQLIQLLDIQEEPAREKPAPITDSLFTVTVWNLQSNMPTFNTYNNLKNTNKLSLITDKTINEKFTALEFSLNRLEDILVDRLGVHQLRIDHISENEINFIPTLKSVIPEVNVKQESVNDYEEVLRDKRVRNLLGIKLSFTHDIIERRENLYTEINELIHLIEKELKDS